MDFDSIDEFLENCSDRVEDAFEWLEPTKFTYKAGSLGFVAGGTIGGAASFGISNEVGQEVYKTFGYYPAVASASTIFVVGTLFGGYRLAKAGSKVEKRINEEYSEFDLRELPEHYQDFLDKYTSSEEYEED